jgi:hypothetical protein
VSGYEATTTRACSGTERPDFTKTMCVEGRELIAAQNRTQFGRYDLNQKGTSRHDPQGACERGKQSVHRAS